MEATFFACQRSEAMGVCAVDDLPCEPAGESLPIGSPGVLIALARILGAEAGVRPLRDATCRSFPVFEFASSVTRDLGQLSDSGIDDAAESWLADPCWQGCDVDLFEASTLLCEIRSALKAAESPEAGLFALLEEKAL